MTVTIWNQSVAQTACERVENENLGGKIEAEGTTSLMNDNG